MYFCYTITKKEKIHKQLLISDNIIIILLQIINNVNDIYMLYNTLYDVLFNLDLVVFLISFMLYGTLLMLYVILHYML